MIECSVCGGFPPGDASGALDVCVCRVVGYRFESNHQVWYVAQLPGEGGVDWGYVFKAEQARVLTPYWQRRFRADCRRVNREAQFVDAPIVAGM